MVAATETELAMADDLTRRILSSAKYRSLDETLVRRVAVEAAQRFRDRNEAVKYAKRKLHQAFGAFLKGSPSRAAAGVITAVRSGQSELRPAAASAMAAHASSAERVTWLALLYDQVAEWCGTAASVADLACGLNPLAIPWMQLAPDASYWACEIDAAPPALTADVALLLKAVTTLEQQSAGAAGRVLAALDCRHVIVSLPRRSLSGRREYSVDPAAVVAAVAGGSRYRVRDEASFGNELVYHLTPER
jgi:16S rRNA (guanine(1405)-N(7))-methyltransferase